ncbi:MAG: hypothetical protein KDA48_16395, partial [Amphiplicatus sp.]|nr:hypothetical protein [Amphiplicatus sp.]
EGNYGGQSRRDAYQIPLHRFFLARSCSKARLDPGRSQAYVGPVERISRGQAAAPYDFVTV